MMALASFHDFAPAFFSSVGLVVMPWMRPALSSGAMSAFTAESQKMRGPLGEGCLSVLPFLLALITGIFSRRASMAALLGTAGNMMWLRVLRWLCLSFSCLRNLQFTAFLRKFSSIFRYRSPSTREPRHDRPGGGSGTPSGGVRDYTGPGNAGRSGPRERRPDRSFRHRSGPAA